MTTQNIIDCWESGIEPYNATKHTWAKDGFCIYCHNVHRTDHNARSTCSDGYRCRAKIPDQFPTA